MLLIYIHLHFFFVFQIIDTKVKFNLNKKKNERVEECLLTFFVESEKVTNFKVKKRLYIHSLI